MRFKLSTAALAACAAAALTAGSASASITYFPYGVGAPVLPLITNFSADSLNTAPTHKPVGWSWVGNGAVFNTSNTAHSEPAVGPGNGHKPAGVHYLAVNTGQSEQLNISTSAHIDDVSMYVGSLDSFNKLTFDFVGGSSVSYTGAQLAALTTALANGNQLSSKSNGIFNFVFNKAVTSIDFQSKGTSFEIADIWGKSIVPEPSEWVMLTLGVAMVGAVARRRRSFAGAAAIA